MFKYALKSVGVMFKYAPYATVIKFIEVIITATMTPLSLYFTQRLINDIDSFVKGDLPFLTLLTWAILLVATMLFAANSNFINGIQYVNMQRRLNQGFTRALVGKYQKLDYACFEDNEVQDTLSRMGNAPQDRIFAIFLGVVGVISLTITIFGLALLFIQISVWFSLVFLAMLFFMVWLDYKAMSMMDTMFNSQTEEERKMSYLSSLLSNKASLYELKIFGAIDYIKNKWAAKTSKVLSERLRTTIRSQKYFAISSLCILVWVGYVVFSLINGIIKNNISVGVFVALVGSAGSVLGTTELLAHTFSNLSQRYLQMKHYDIFIHLPEIDNTQTEEQIVNPHIIFENVHFTYPNTHIEILKGVSFEISPNESVALVGENGAGKSTIIKLLCKLYKPDSGRITVNGKDINSLSQYQLRQVFSVVFQDFISYSLTLRENVAFGDIEKLNDDVAIKIALKQGMAENISDNIDINLGKIEETGVDLSGGQWQRIAIARASIANSAFVILDEPTASLDPLAESEMYKSFAEVLKNRGCVMISHRLASARMADKIVVISDGIVKETGSHTRLLKQNSLYATMWRTQSAWYKGGGDIA